MSQREGGTEPPFFSTHFLPAERASALVLEEEIVRASASPVVSALLRLQGGAMAVLNAERQVVAVNDAGLALLGVRAADDAIGLRPGEAVRCVHAWEGPGGCGTGPCCGNCGAAIALAAAQRGGLATERECALRVERGDAQVDLQLRVRAAPLRVAECSFTVLLLEDVTDESRRRALEGTFFHDVNGLLAALLGAAEEQAAGDRDPALARDVARLAAMVAQEVALQRALLFGDPALCTARPEPVLLSGAIDSLRLMLVHHPAAAGKRLEVEDRVAGSTIPTDRTLLGRVLFNMALNALEATLPGGAVRLRVEAEGSGVSVSVWNAGAIPSGVVGRIFQRFFSTKPGSGRGHGTYSMKLFAGLLGGAIGFTSSAEAGTWFRLTLPARALLAPATAG